MNLTKPLARNVYNKCFPVKRGGQHIMVKDTFKHVNCFLFKLFVACVENWLLDGLLIKKNVSWSISYCIQLFSLLNWTSTSKTFFLSFFLSLAITYTLSLTLTPPPIPAHTFLFLPASFHCSFSLFLTLFLSFLSFLPFSPILSHPFSFFLPYNIQTTKHFTSQQDVVTRLGYSKLAN